MIRKPQVLIVGGGEIYLGLAKQKLALLEKERLRSFLPERKKVIALADATIHLRCNRYAYEILILGGMNPQIVLSTGSVLWGFNYDDDKLASLMPLAEASELHPFFLGTVHAGVKSADTKARRSGDLSPLVAWQGQCLQQNPEVEWLLSGQALYARSESEAYPIITLPNSTWSADHFRVMAGLLHLGRYETTPPWNLMATLDVWSANATNQNALPAWRWTPNFFFSEAGNGILPPGWFYGQYLGWYQSAPGDAAITDGRVTFGGFLDGRKPDAITPYGYCETLTSINGVDTFLTCFYLSASPVGTLANDNYVYASPSGFKYGGTSIGGKDPAFYFDSLSALGPLTSDPDIHFWSAPAVEGESADLMGVVVAANGKALVYRWHGYETQLATIDAYHSHSVSSDGSILAVFEGSEVISAVKVWDLTAESPYLLRDSEVVASLSAANAAVVPIRSEGFTPSPLPYDLSASSPNAVSDTDTTTDMPTAGSVMFPQDGGVGGTTAWKILCDDGVHAQAMESNDSCFEWQASLITPTGDIADPASVTVDGTAYNGASFSDLAAQVPFKLWQNTEGPYEIVLAHWNEVNGLAVPKSAGATAGAGTAVNYVGRNPMGITVFEDGHVEATFGHEPIEWTNVDAQGFPVAAPNCTGGAVTITATDACGQYDEAEIATPVPSPVAVSGPDAPVIGDFFGASGGSAPYTFAISAGTIDQGTGELLSYPACVSGQPRWATVTATDSCGAQATMDVRLPGGQWIYVREVRYPAPVGADSYLSSCGYTWNMNDYGWQGSAAQTKATRDRIVGGSKFHDYGYWRTTWLDDLNKTPFCQGQNIYATSYAWDPSLGVWEDEHEGKYWSSTRGCCNPQAMAIVRYWWYEYEWRCP